MNNIITDTPSLSSEIAAMSTKTQSMSTKTPSMSAKIPTMSNKTQSMSAKMATMSAKMATMSTITTDVSKWSWNTIFRYGIIIVILSLLGFNLFTYLGLTMDFINKYIKLFLAFIGYNSGNIIKQTVNTSADGIKGVVDVSKDTITGGIDILENTLSDKKYQRNKIDDHSKSIGKAININLIKEISEEPEPDDAGSRTQTNRSLNKTGFCYIGEDRGFRSCIKVGEGDTCMSGDIFSTEAICINPNLRI